MNYLYLYLIQIIQLEGITDKKIVELKAIMETYNALFCDEQPLSQSLDQAGLQYMKSVKVYIILFSYMNMVINILVKIKQNM